MLKIGKLILKEKYHIASSFTDSDIIQSNKNIQPQLVLAYKNNLDIIEVRIDQFNRFNTDYVTTNIKTARELVKSTPIIATIRHPDEDKNSLWQDNEKDRLYIYEIL